MGRRGVSANRRRRWSNQRRPASVGPPGRQENGRRVAGSADRSQSVSESNRVRQQCEQRRPRAHRPNTLTHPHASTPTLGHTDSTTPRPTRRNDDQPKMAHVRAANNGSLFGARKLTQEDRAELLEQFQSVSTRSTLVSASVRHFFCCFGRPSVRRPPARFDCHPSCIFGCEMRPTNPSTWWPFFLSFPSSHDADWPRPVSRLVPRPALENSVRTPKQNSVRRRFTPFFLRRPPGKLGKWSDEIITGR